MPRGRMLNKEISVSRKLPQVSIYARLLFTWTIPHLDVGGKIFGNPDQIKGIVVPYCEDFTIKRIKNCLEELSSKGLIVVYGDENCQYLFFPGFETNQNINENRESGSIIPNPTPEQLQSNAGETPQEVKLSKVKIREGLTHSLQLHVFDNLPNVSSLKNQLTEEECNKIIDKYGINLVKEKLEKMENYKKLNKSYVSVYLTLNHWCKNSNNVKQEQGIILK